MKWSKSGIKDEPKRNIRCGWLTNYYRCFCWRRRRAFCHCRDKHEKYSLKMHHKLLRDYVYKWCPLLDMSSQLTLDYHHDLRMFQPFQQSCSNIFLFISMLLLYIQKINADTHRFHLIARIDQMFERVEIVNCFIKLIISARHSLFILHRKIYIIIHFISKSNFSILFFLDCNF